MTRGFLDERGRGLDVVEIEADVLRETDKAWQVYDGATEAWLPKSLVERHGDHFMMPKWMATEKRLS